METVKSPGGKSSPSFPKLQLLAWRSQEGMVFGLGGGEKAFPRASVPARASACRRCLATFQ